MTNEIEEMAKDICKGCQTRISSEKKCDRNCCAMSEVVAERLYKAGYRKTVWHKVADGDLPNYKQIVLLAWKNVNGEIIVDTSQFIDGRFLDVRTADAIAWTELPKYKEEEKAIQNEEKV